MWRDPAERGCAEESAVGAAHNDIMKREVFIWDRERMEWTPLVLTRRQRWIRRAWLGVIVMGCATLLHLGADFLVTTPEELALLYENRALQAQVVSADARFEVLAERLDALELQDAELYRVMLQVDAVPEALRQVGTGGTKPHEELSRFSPSTARLLGQLEQQMDQLERRLDLQAGSTRELMALSETHVVRSNELPAIMPAMGRLTSSFGMRRHPIYKTRRHHDGIDITIPSGSPVYATADGVVSEVNRGRTGYGIHIVIRHETSGLQTLYAHLQEVMPSIQPGRRVKRGQHIALSGNTGLSVAPHLHYEVHTLDGVKLNPFPYLAPQMSASEYAAILDLSARP